MQLVDVAHLRQILLSGGLGPVVHRTSADFQELDLARHAQGVITVDHRYSLSVPALVSALSKKSFSSAN